MSRASASADTQSLCMQAHRDGSADGERVISFHAASAITLLMI